MRIPVVGVSRRLLVQAVVVLALVVGGTALVAQLLVRAADLPSLPAAPQDRPGPVLLVPGYGGSTAALEQLAVVLRAAGRQASVVPLPGDGTGDLQISADALGRAADAALTGGAPSVDVIGYSAGGVVARLWAEQHPSGARRVVTLGSPHHGTQIAALGAAFSPGSCPAACQQLVPGSELLNRLNEDESPDGPQWLALWTTQDEIVTPPDSARLEGAVNVAVQDLCPGLQVTHAQLPVAPAVQRLVLQALSAAAVEPPTGCPTS